MMTMQRKLNLSMQEKQLLWATLSNDHVYQYKLALNIYRSLFDLIPEAVDIFPASMHPNAPDVSKSPEFQRMALYLVRTLWLAVKNVDHPEQQAEMLHGIGKMHTAYAYKGLKTEHWSAMESAMLLAIQQHVEDCSALPNSDDKKSVVEIWSRIISSLIDATRKGFNDTICKQEKTLFSSCIG